MESVLCNESDFGINMNNVTNHPLILPHWSTSRSCWPVGVTSIGQKAACRMAGVSGLQNDGVRSSSGNRLLIEQQLADKPGSWTGFTKCVIFRRH